MFRYFFLGILFILLSACTQNNQPLDGQSLSRNPLLPLTTSDENTVPMEESGEIVIIDEEKGVSPGFAVPFEDPGKQANIDTPVVLEDFQLPFDDFKERWNAISAEQASNLEISGFERENERYICQLRNGLELHIIQAENKVQKVVLIGKTVTSQDKLAMLAGWSQIVYMFEPEVNTHQIDDLFKEIGVGPNLDLKQIQEKEIERGDVHYLIKPESIGYRFEALYSADRS